MRQARLTYDLFVRGPRPDNQPIEYKNEVNELIECVTNQSPQEQFLSCFISLRERDTINHHTILTSLQIIFEGLGAKSEKQHSNGATKRKIGRWTTGHQRLGNLLAAAVVQNPNWNSWLPIMSAKLVIRFVQQVLGRFEARNRCRASTAWTNSWAQTVALDSMDNPFSIQTITTC